MFASTIGEVMCSICTDTVCIPTTVKWQMLCDWHMQDPDKSDHNPSRDISLTILLPVTMRDESELKYECQINS